ncbi:MAG: aminoacyl-tRNA deacylase [Gemmatimonadales bacterium]
MTITHSPAFTAQEVAHAAHVSGKDLAKVVVMKLDGRLAMAVVPAPERVDLDALAEATGAREVVLAPEVEFAQRFPDCDRGAMPPFGNLYGMEVYVDGLLAGDRELAFPAGSHSEVIRMAYRDFERLVNPTVVPFAVHA